MCLCGLSSTARDVLILLSLLLALVPNARVVLTTREPFEWAAKRKRDHDEWAYLCDKSAWQRMKPGSPMDLLWCLKASAGQRKNFIRSMSAVSRNDAARAFHDYNSFVAAAVPPERLLNFSFFGFASHAAADSAFSRELKNKFGVL